MKKSYKIEVDCPNCAAKMEVAAKKTEGVVDAVVSLSDLSLDFVKKMEELAPFGQGNPSPIFVISALFFIFPVSARPNCCIILITRSDS